MPTEQEDRHSENLRLAQQSRRQNNPAAELAGTVKNISTPMGAFSLRKQVNIFDDMPYIIALIAALLKDALDLAFIGSLPGIGTVITICCSILIFL